MDIVVDGVDVDDILHGRLSELLSQRLDLLLSHFFIFYALLIVDGAAAAVVDGVDGVTGVTVTVQQL